VLLEAALGAIEGIATRRELTLDRPQDKPGVFNLTVSPFHAADGKVAHVIVEITDVSALIETRMFLAQARRLEALGKLSGGVAHDINNMLGAIVGANELVLLDARRGDWAGIQQSSTLIHDAVDRAAALTKQLLAFGRQDRWNSEQLDAHRLVAGMVQLLQRTLRKEIEVVHQRSEAPAHVRADAAALEHALLNLALNAQDAMPNGGTLTLTTEVVELDPSERARRGLGDAAARAVLLRVTDTGSGMSDEVRERAFEPFFTTKPVANGSGLGLAAVHGTVLSHGGAIALHSQPGVGTTFDIYLPALPPVSDLPRQTERRLPSVLQRGAAVVMADDEPLVRLAVVSMLESLGCKVRALDSGEALLDALHQGPTPDLILSDLAMPGLSGLNLVHAIELAHATCPLLLITGFSGEDVSAALPPRPLRKLLRKPFTRSDLAAALQELLEDGAVRGRSVDTAG
jgi:signal transduction histidine kinase/CheY-like chemotaxis protein